jgi:RND family efflux transporter MFP subunit
MTRRGWSFLLVAAIALAGGGLALRNYWTPSGAAAQSPSRTAVERVVPVRVATAVKKPVPVRIEALGAVAPMASVAIKARLETEIVGVHFQDGAEVKAGDQLFTLDARALQAQILQAEGALARDKAQLEGAERDVKRFADLLTRNAGTVVSVDNAKTQADMLRGTVRATEAALQNLRVQLSYTTITAPIPGRISAANVKVGNFVRPSDTTPLATINQVKPIYVVVGVPQRVLPEVREAMLAGRGKVEAMAPGQTEPSLGQLSMLDNSVDATTGMVSVRAVVDNADEALWPGTLVNVALILKVEDAVTIPAVAVQTGQSGTYVFMVSNGAAEVRQVTVARTVDGEAVISQGLTGSETVVIDGQLLLANGVKVAPRQAQQKAAGS